ncbi:hypothetical protein M271_38685 [Streptomyces rapamycinicus NRRL 5491]|nr:hypothetical protein M271_38685 [Streptomyces rapamycinicus NRRL 5491]
MALGADRCLGDLDVLGLASKASVYLLSRSRMRKRTESMRMPRSVARLRSCWVAQAAVGCVVTLATCRRRVRCSRKTRAFRRCKLMVSMRRKSQAMRPMACVERNSRQVGPVWRGAGSIPAVWRIWQMVEAAIGCSSRASSR